MTTLGKYELHEQLGRGGFGTVYRATDTDLDRVVALKILHPQLTTDPDFLNRFRNEARLVANLRSPHIVTIHELGEVDGRVFIAMEYLAGGSLKQRLETGPVPYTETVEIMRQVCDGLTVAHAKGLVHRDIKPGNILFDIDGRAVIADFGLARAMQVSSSSASSSMGGVGTPAYRAPELWRGKPPASPATDIYSLGCVLSEMLTGKTLFDGSTPDEIITQHLVDGPQIPQKFPGKTPNAIRPVIEKALAKDPQDRYQQALEFLVAAGKLKEQIFEPAPAVPLIPVVNRQAQPFDLPALEDVLPVSQEPHKGALWALPLIFAGITLVIMIIVFGESTDWFGMIRVITQAPAAPLIAASETQGPNATNTAMPTMAATLTSVPPTPTERAVNVSPMVGKDGMTLVYVPGGTFTMGASAEDVYEDCQKYSNYCQKEWYIGQEPPHQVTLNPFWIDQTEVTNSMYLRCVEDGECTPPGIMYSHTREDYYESNTYSNYPVVAVTLEQAIQYCSWANRELPTEAQWEYAARGPESRIYPWGSDTPTCELANFGPYDIEKSCIAGGDTWEAGSHPAGESWVGAFDLAGNVMEWVRDVFLSYSSDALSNPLYLNGSDYYVIRGGYFGSDEIDIRSASRGGVGQSTVEPAIGFRCVLPIQ